LSDATIPTAIAIDGPAASGKTTIGQMLAQHLDYLLLDTGSMYRAATYAALEAGLDLEDETAVVELTAKLRITIADVTEAKRDGRRYTVYLNDEDVTWGLRSPQVDAHVSLVSSYSGVRQILVERQRQMAEERLVVMVGRDIGTVVLPDAALKLYIVASADERARRRHQERLVRGSDSDYEAILADVIRRDEIDGNRTHSPMRPAEDAVMIDTTGRTPEQILAEILALPVLMSIKDSAR
jgi:CMP/dCMP kinase